MYKNSRFLRLFKIFSQLHLIAGLDSRLPFTVEDANRPETESDTAGVKYKRVLLDTRLNNRVVELRVSITFLDASLRQVVNYYHRRKPIRPYLNSKVPLAISSANILTSAVLLKSTAPSCRELRPSLVHPSSKSATSKVSNE